VGSAHKETNMSNVRNNLIVSGLKRWGASDGDIVALENVGLAFGDHVVLDSISLRIPVGKTTVIMGESGSGKSVLLKTMNGLLMPTSGSCRLFGEETRACSTPGLNVLRKRTGMILQDYALFDSSTVFENVAFPLVENAELPASQIRALVEEALEPLGLLDAIDKYPSELSGGMKKRVSFARAVIHQPELVFFDEPTTGLDPIMIAFVDEIIREMRRRYDITSVIISHDIQSIYRLADYVAFLHRGRILFEGTLEQIRACEIPEVQRFFDAENKQDKEALTLPNRPYVEIRDLYKSFGARTVLKGVSLKIPEHQITVIIGGSGSGKSVLMKHILGLFSPDSGQILLDGVDIGGMNEREREVVRTRIGMLFQGAALFDSITIEENVAFPLTERRNPPPGAEIRTRVWEMLERLKIVDIAKKYPPEISAGQRKRVALARAIVTKPALMIYDEPTTGQDPVMIRYVDDMILEAHAAFGLTTIVISHDMVSTFRIADQVAVVYDGRIAVSDSPQAVLDCPKEEVQRLIRAQLSSGGASSPTPPAMLTHCSGGKTLSPLG